jgi:hypothetical protein
VRPFGTFAFIRFTRFDALSGTNLATPGQAVKKRIQSAVELS